MKPEWYGIADPGMAPRISFLPLESGGWVLHRLLLIIFRINIKIKGEKELYF